MIKRIVFTIFLVSIYSTNCLAENWVGVGDDWYYDKDSKRRNGDLASVMVRSMGYSGKAETENYVFDCKREKHDFGGYFKDVKPLRDEIKTIYTYACKSWYEVWK